MIRRLEQVAALVVAAGLALVSYWLFFSWAGGGDGGRRQPGHRSAALGEDHASQGRLRRSPSPLPSAPSTDQEMLARSPSPQIQPFSAHLVPPSGARIGEATSPGA